MTIESISQTCLTGNCGKQSLDASGTVPRMKIANIEIRHASAAVMRRTRAWFKSDGKAGAIDGNRSVHLPHPEKRGMALKIKGAGYNGGAIRFGALCETGPAALAFDFDGRAMPDVASGHNNAFLGAASFQQASTEFNVTRCIEELGVPVVPCLGYGRLDTERHTAWFSIFEWDRNWSSVAISRDNSMAEYLQANHRLTEIMLRLAVEHDLVGYCGLVLDGPGSYRLKDLHPFRKTDPITSSQLSWVMQVLFALNIRCQAIQYFPAAAKRPDMPADIVVHALRPLLADATQDDYEVMRTRIVKPYLRFPIETFDPRELSSALHETRVGSALLELCPAKYARW